MEQLMEWLTQIFGEGADLAAIASAAGVGGGALSVVTAFFFRGFFMKLLAQIVTTAIMTGVGFLALLHMLGFEIVPKDGTLAADIPIFQPGLAQPESAPRRAEDEDDGKKVKIYYKSPWRRG